MDNVYKPSVLTCKENEALTPHFIGQTEAPQNRGRKQELVIREVNIDPLILHLERDFNRSRLCVATGTAGSYSICVKESTIRCFRQRALTALSPPLRLLRISRETWEGVIGVDSLKAYCKFMSSESVRVHHPLPKRYLYQS